MLHMEVAVFNTNCLMDLLDYQCPNDLELLYLLYTGIHLY